MLVLSEDTSKQETRKSVFSGNANPYLKSKNKFCSRCKEIGATDRHAAPKGRAKPVIRPYVACASVRNARHSPKKPVLPAGIVYAVLWVSFVPGCITIKTLVIVVWWRAVIVPTLKFAVPVVNTIALFMRLQNLVVKTGVTPFMVTTSICSWNKSSRP